MRTKDWGRAVVLDWGRAVVLDDDDDDGARADLTSQTGPQPDKTKSSNVFLVTQVSGRQTSNTTRAPQTAEEMLSADQDVPVRPTDHVTRRPDRLPPRPYHFRMRSQASKRSYLSHKVARASLVFRVT